jgi:hypothetical protein
VVGLMLVCNVVPVCSGGPQWTVGRVVVVALDGP